MILANHRNTDMGPRHTTDPEGEPDLPDILHDIPWMPQAFRWLRESLAREHSRARKRLQMSGISRGLLDWARCFLPHHFALPPSRMHEVVARYLERAVEHRGLRLNVLAPRGSAKSTLASLAYPLWCLLEGHEPYIWLVSDSRHQARAHLENIKRELESNERLKSHYGRLTDPGPVWRAERITLSSGATLEAFGTGQRMRGRRHLSHRPTLILADDLQNDGHIISPRQREHSRTWFHGTLLAAGSPQTNVVHLATALHWDALGLQLSQTPGWKTLLFRAIERFPTRMDLWSQWENLYSDLRDPQAPQHAREFYEHHRAEMDEGAVVLWPQRENLYQLMCQRAEMGAAAFAREKQNHPVSPESCEWPEDYFDEAIWFDAWPEHRRLCVVAVDPSQGKDSRRGDFSAVVVLIIDTAGRMYVEADLARRPVPQLVADTVACCRRFPVDALGVEANQFQELLAEPLEAEFRRQGLVGFSPWMIHNHTSKVVRIRRLGPFLARRMLRFRRNSAGTRLLVEQLRMFPTASHDDGPDALEMAIRLAGELLRSPGETHTISRMSVK